MSPTLLLPILAMFVAVQGVAGVAGGVHADEPAAPPASQSPLEVYETTLVVDGEPVGVSTADLPDGASVTVQLRDGRRVSLALDGGVVARTEGPRVPRTTGLAPVQRLAEGGPRLVTDEHRLLLADGTTSIGTFGGRPGLFDRPRGIAVDRGRIFVADTGNHRVQVFAEDGELLHQVGLHQLEPREGKGRMHYPTSIAVSPAGDRLFVAEPLEGRVQVFRARREEDPPPDPALSWVRADLPAHYGEHWALRGPWLLICEPDAERVTLHRIREGREPVMVSEIGGVAGDRLGEFRNPGAVRFLPSGDPEEGPVRAVVADRGNARVVVLEVLPLDGDVRFDPRLVRVVKARAAPVEELVSLAVDEAGGILVAGRDRIERLRPDLSPDPDFEAIRGEGIREVYAAPGRPEVFVVEDTAEGASVRRPGVPRVRAFDCGGLAWLADGSLVLSDAAAHRLLVVAPDGTERSIGGQGTGPAEFHHPRAVAVDGEGRIWVLDHGNHRGQVLETDGTVRIAFGSRAYTAPIRRALREGATAGSPEEQERR